jgi:hypothetical protein
MKYNSPMAITRIPAHVLVEHLRNNQSRMALDVLDRFGFDIDGTMINNLARYRAWDTSWAPTMAAAWEKSEKSQHHAMDALYALLARTGHWEKTAPMADWLLERINPANLVRRCPIHHAAFHGQIEAMPILLKHIKGDMDPKAYDWTTPLEGQPDTPLSLALESGDIDTITGVRFWGGASTEQMRIILPTPKTIGVDAYAGQRSKKREEIARSFAIGRDRAALLSCMNIENWADLFHHMNIDEYDVTRPADSNGEERKTAARRM